MEIVIALASVIEARSLETGAHIKRIGLYLRTILNQIMLDYPEYGLDSYKINVIVNASVLHDIGKIVIPDAILNKPGRLTVEEYNIIKSHTTAGCNLLSKLDNAVSDKEYLACANNICLYHHERYDGKGYPEGLIGDKIPLEAQVTGIADCFDALTSIRVYKKSVEPVKAWEMIKNGECGAFNPKLIDSVDKVSDQLISLADKYASSEEINLDI